MIETTDVRPFMEMLPERRYNLTVNGKPEKVPSGKTHYRLWKFLTEEGKSLELRFYPWESKELLLAVGGKPNGNNVEWDDDKVDGKAIEADLVSETYTKKDGKEGKKQVLRNIEQGINF